MIVCFKQRCPSFKMYVRLSGSNWGRTLSLQIKLPLRKKKGPFSVRPEVNNNNSKCGPFPGCLKPLRIPIRCCFVVFVAPLQWFMPLPGWVLANIFYLYSQGICDCNHPFPADLNVPSTRQNAASKLICHFLEELRVWGSFLSVGLIRASPANVHLFIFSLRGPCRLLIPTAAV